MTEHTNGRSMPQAELIRRGRPTKMPQGRIIALKSAAAAAPYVEAWERLAEDPLEKAQAIVVLSGRMPLRAMEAAKLYRKGFAPKVWLTRPTEPGAALEAMGIPFVGEDFYNSRILMHEGVPADAIRVLQPSILNTADELTAVSAHLGKNGQKVIIVTSKVHTRRGKSMA
jgi:uncharacterized SAM-binding protein YcdF (DUF218 family)